MGDLTQAELCLLDELTVAELFAGWFGFSCTVFWVINFQLNCLLGDLIVAEHSAVGVLTPGKLFI